MSFAIQLSINQLEIVLINVGVGKEPLKRVSGISAQSSHKAGKQPIPDSLIVRTESLIIQGASIRVLRRVLAES